MKVLRKYVQWVIAYTPLTIGFFALLVLAGDDNPAHPISNFDWFAIKGIAAAVIYICYIVDKFLYKIGYMPEIGIDDNEEEDFYE